MNSSQPQAVSAAISFACLPCASSLRDLQTEVAALLNNNRAADNDNCTLDRGNWLEHVNRNDYSGEWDLLPLRCLSEHVNAHPILQGFALEAEGTWENLPVLEQCPALAAVISSLQCPVKAARLMRLKAGAHIKPHRDAELGIDYGQARLHLPIFTSTDIAFYVHQQRVPMAAGELWYINADQVHEVHNPGVQDRINLVIDCIANEWLRTQIIQGVL